MVMCLGLYRSLPRYLCGSSGPVRRERRRASNTGKEEPSLARPHFVALSRSYMGNTYSLYWTWGSERQWIHVFTCAPTYSLVPQLLASTPHIPASRTAVRINRSLGGNAFGGKVGILSLTVAAKDLRCTCEGRGVYTFVLLQVLAWNSSLCGCMFWGWPMTHHFILYRIFFYHLPVGEYSCIHLYSFFGVYSQWIHVFIFHFPRIPHVGLQICNKSQINV